MSYLFAGQPSELDRLRAQALVWEPAGRALLDRIGLPASANALDVGCGALGWLRILAERGAQVVGADLDERMLAAARAFIDEQALTGVTVVKDDLFDSRLPAASFDLVHARFQIAPLGRAQAQLAAFRRLVRPGGVIVLEEPDSASWRYHPRAPSCERLIDLVRDCFETTGGAFDAGTSLFALLRDAGLAPELDAKILALPPGHGYLRVPLSFAQALAPKLTAAVGADELARLRAAAETELAAPERWGTTFTLIQAWARC